MFGLRVMLALLATRLKRHGRVRFASDDRDYAEQVRSSVSDSPDWFNLAGHGAWAPRPDERIVTRFV